MRKYLIAIVFLNSVFFANASQSVDDVEICQKNSDCPVGALCRSISGGGARCIYQKNVTNTTEKIASLCEVNSDCDMGYICRSISGGGAMCKRDKLIFESDDLLSDELTLAKNICNRRGLSERSQTYQKCLDSEFEKLVSDETQRILIDNRRYQESIRERSLNEERRRKENLERERNRAIVEEIKRNEAASAEAAERRRQSEMLLRLGIGILNMGNTQNIANPKNCFLKNDVTSGFHKTCIYSCPTGMVTSTVGAVEICPLTR